MLGSGADKKKGTISKGTSDKLMAKQEAGLTGKESKGALKEGWLTKQGTTTPLVVFIYLQKRQLHQELAASLVPTQGRHAVLLQGSFECTF